MRKYSMKTAGFSLVEMAIVVTIMGVLAGGVLAVSSNKIEKTALRNTSEKLKEIDDAIKAYYGRYGKIPCPAIATATEGTSAYGLAIDCTNGVEDYPEYTVNFVDDVNQVAFGNVPVRTLGLSESMMYDEWGNRIMYGAVVELAKSRTIYDMYTTPATDGVIKIIDGNGNQILDPKTTHIVPYVLISYGKDKKGAFGRKIPENGLPNVRCGSDKDSENCDFGDPNTNNAVIMDSQINDANTADYYYDLVRWTTKDRLKTYNVGVADVKDVKGYSTKCAIKADDTLWCWGYNKSKILGELPDSKAFSDVPVPVAGKNKWKAIDIAEIQGIDRADIYSFICGIKMDQSLWCWGDGRAGHLGTSVQQGFESEPLQVYGGGQWKSVHVSYEQVCAIKVDDTLWCWGVYVDDMDAAPSVVDEPTQIGVGTTWKNVSVGATKSCAVRTDNSLWCWKVRTVIYLMHDRYWAKNAMDVPEQIAVGETWKSADVAGGDVKSHSSEALPVICAVKVDDSLWCWGDNRYGQLGDGTKTERVTPAPVSGGGAWKQVFASALKVCAIKADDSLWCWGDNRYGQLGDGTTTDRLVPTQVSGGGAWLTVSQDDIGTCGIKANATLWCWGSNTTNRLGTNTGSSSVLLPKEVSESMRWSALSQMGSAVCAIRDDRKVFCWGGGLFGEIGNDTNIKENGLSYIELRP